MAEIHQLVSKNLQKIASAVTMTSLEMVEYINTVRKEEALAAGAEFPSAEFAELRHRDFTAKVPKVLGKEMSEKFRTSLKDAYGRNQPGYTFPKREACLMAMSYSYELQAKVYDHMTELESKLALPIVSTGEIERIARSQLGGIMKSVVHKEIQDAINSILPALVHGELAKHQMSVRRGHTAGQVWNAHGLPKVKGAAVMLSNRLETFGCMIDGDGRAEMGGRTAKLFDPDKASKAMKSGLLDFCQKYVKNRNGQHSLFPLKSV